MHYSNYYFSKQLFFCVFFSLFITTHPCLVFTQGINQSSNLNEKDEGWYKRWYRRTVVNGLQRTIHEIADELQYRIQEFIWGKNPAPQLKSKKRLEQERERFTETIITTETTIILPPDPPDPTKNPFAVADWINSIHYANFCHPYIRKIHQDDKNFTEISSLGQLQVYLQPVALYSAFDWNEKNLQLKNWGTQLGISYSIDQNRLIGVGTGYIKSTLDCGNLYNRISINSFLLAPYFSYLFTNGYASIVLLCSYQFYRGTRKEDVVSDISDIPAKGINLAPMLEGGVDIIFKDQFILQPNLQVNYLHALYSYDVIQNPDQEKEVWLNFIRSAFNLSVRKEFFYVDWGIFLPEFSVGWVLMKPFKTKPINLRHLLALGIQSMFMFKQGFFLQLKFNAEIGEYYPSFCGSVRLEWDW